MSSEEEEYDYSDELGDNDYEDYDYDDDMSSDYGEAAAATADYSASPLKRVSSYRVVKISEVAAMMKELVDDCAETLEFTPEESHIHLCYYKWNIRKLQEDWFENRSKVSKCVPCSSVSGAKVKVVDSLSTVECAACYSEYTAGEMPALPCGHRFCKDCWQCYTTEGLNMGVPSVFLRCMQDGCEEAIGPEFFRQVLEPSKKERYNRYMMQSFCNNNKDIAWCPSPGCTYVIEYPGGGRSDITCLCGHKFCFHCREDAHRPASCEDVEKWNEKNSAESENVTWIIANTKKCPKCRKPIEKNQGCNHMTCHKNIGGCGHEFCWLCMGDWKDHGQETGGYYRCNKYELAKASGSMKEADSERETAKHALEKYMHYFQRFMNHQRSLKFGVRTLKDIEEKMERLLAEKDYKITEVTFMKKAATQVIECRRVLQWTYVFGYYLKDGPEKELFEFLQENLEKDTETLHELVEAPLDKYLNKEAKKEVFFQHRSNVTNYASVTAKFMQNLLDGIENGLTTEMPRTTQPFKRARTSESNY